MISLGKCELETGGESQALMFYKYFFRVEKVKTSQKTIF
jgi:hypothetical protein